MPLPPLNYTTAHVVLNVPVDEPTVRTEDIKQQLAMALHGQFEARAEQALPDEAPAEIPYMILPGRSSQIAFSQVQAVIEIEFHDAYTTKADLCRALVRDKMELLLRAWDRVGARPVWQGLVLTLRASTIDQPESSVRHMLETHLRPGLDSDALHDAKLHFGLRLQDHYFVTLGIGHYEARRIQRQVAGSGPIGPIRPWEGEVSDEGLELTVDINNRYGALLERRHTRVTAEGLRTMNDVAWELVEKVAVPLAKDGVLDLRALHEATV
jgi:hypothetical protein